MSRKQNRTREKVSKITTKFSAYLTYSWDSINGLGALFGRNKWGVLAGFFFQPALAFGQLLFGYSVFYTLAYVFFFNYLLIRYAKQKRSGGGK